MTIDGNCTLPRTVGLQIWFNKYILLEVLIDSLGRDSLLFPEPRLFHFEPWEYSLHLLEKKKEKKKSKEKKKINIKVYIFSKSASGAIKKNVSNNHKYLRFLPE